MASLVDFRPHPSHTPPIDTQPVDNNAPPFTDISPRAYSPPIKMTTNTNPHATQTPASNPSTPGLEIPGAFPREQVSASAGTSGPTQKQNAPERSRTQSYPLPAVPKHLSGAKTTLPSTEKEGTKPGEHYDGVGPLPGSISETSVARLPDERNEYLGEPGDRSESDRQPATTTTRPAAVSLPSQEKMGVQPYEHYDGVGPLPGTSSETSVAKLPDERKAEGRSSPGVVSGGGPLAGITNLGMQARRVGPLDPASSAQKAPPPPERDDREKVPGYSKFKEDVAAAAEEKGSAGPAEAKGSERKVENVNYRAAEEERRSLEKDEGATSSLPPSPVVGGDSAAAGGGPTTTQRKPRSSSDSDASHHKRASVMNMVKGEMKVLLGKASRNKDKVEEGEKLKHGSD